MRTMLVTVKLPLLLTLFVVVGCAPGAAPNSQADRQGAVLAPQKTLQIIQRGEPPTLALKSLVPGGGALGIPPRFFNASFAITDTREVTHPHLVEALPQLNTDTWRIFPDGTMETVYRLRPNLTWHDGGPLQAEDFVFAHRVYKTPEMGSANTRPMAQLQEIRAIDARTVVMRWNQPYVEAGELNTGFQGLPRHLLEADFNSMDPVAFIRHPFWTVEYVGLGPYKLDRWEPGAHLSASAFDNYVLGRPKIDRIRINVVNDSQAALAIVLAGEGHFVTNFTFSVEQGLTLEREFARTGAGRVMFAPTQGRIGFFQMRSEYQNPKALADLPVRYAVAHGLDHQSRVDVLDAGKGAIAYALTHFDVPYYAEIDRVVLKHEFDPRRAQELMAQAGWTKAPDGFYVDASGARFTLQASGAAGDKNESEVALYVDSLRRTGFDAQQHIVPVALVDDAEYRLSLPGLSLRGAGHTLPSYTTEQIPWPQNRWRGSNRPGWSNPQYDRTFAQLDRTFAQNERASLIAELERLISVDRALIPNPGSRWSTRSQAIFWGWNPNEPRTRVDPKGKSTSGNGETSKESRR